MLDPRSSILDSKYSALGAQYPSLTGLPSPALLPLCSNLSALRFLLFALCSLLSALSSPLSAQDSRENADFKLAVGLYNDKMYDLAAEQFKNFVSAYTASSQGIEARFYLGLTQMKLQQFDEARVTF